MVRKLSFAAALSLAALPLLAVPSAAQGVVSEWTTVKAPPAPKLQAVTVDPATTALLVMDFNKNTCTAEKRARCLPAIPKAKELLAKARAHNMLVVFTRGGNMKDTDFVDGLGPTDGMPAIAGRANKFTGSDLDKVLKEHGIETVIATGTAANGAVLFTSFGAAELGYKVIVPVDTMPGDDAYSEQVSAWIIANGPTVGPLSTLTTADQIGF
jgi:nicotinamidase-related amidase